MTNDEELKYELASQYADNYRTASRDDAYGAYIDGWDAARANDEEKEDLKRTEKVYWMNREAIEQLKQERDQLRAKLDQVKASCEKLASAFEKLEAGYAGMFGTDTISPKDDAWEMGQQIVSQALTEYKNTQGK